MNRRDFLRGAGVTSLSAGLAANAVGQAPVARPDLDDELKGRPVKVAVIGLGVRGKEILAAVSRMTDKFAPVVMICDTFSAPVFVKKAQALAPTAQFTTDYKAIIANKEIEAIFVATPTHKHKDIVLEAIQAGKHVFCEAPLAHTIEDARDIAKAAKASSLIFHPGLHVRCNGQAIHVGAFATTGSIGKLQFGRAQYHERKSWKLGWPTPERESELNWRLDSGVSLGLVGEVGIHQIDTATWFLKSPPIAITGHGYVAEYQDGRKVADCVQCTFEFPRNFQFHYDASLSNSFEGQYEMFYGTGGAVMLRDLRGWMFRESDAELLGWEVFARKDPLSIGKPENKTGVTVATGIALVADATKQLALGKQPGEVGTDVVKSALYQSCRVFLNSIREGKRSFAKPPTKDRPTPTVAPGYQEGFVATVVAIKANEAVSKNTRVELTPDLFVV